jgi:hypothetical protein
MASASGVPTIIALKLGWARQMLSTLARADLSQLCGAINKITVRKTPRTFSIDVRQISSSGIGFVMGVE